MEYTTEVESIIDDATAKLKTAGKFSMEVEGGFAEIPVIEIVRAIDNGTDLDVDTADRVLRYLLLGKKVTLKNDGEALPGTPFAFNDIDLRWETFECFRQYPMILKRMHTIATSQLIKKLIPPQSLIVPEAAGATS
jgi:hypothetical protein